MEIIRQEKTGTGEETRLSLSVTRQTPLYG